ncbi:MAG: hypothetical protein OXU20_17995, partial [Myxococcales bacterium]|nr:hypothetical protein [Myxococcales bacterium]
DGQLADTKAAERAMSRGYRRIGLDATAETYAQALQVAVRLGRPKRQLCLCWSTLTGLAAAGGDARFYDIGAAPWLVELKHASGYNDWLVLPPSGDPTTRVLRALTLANERYDDTPEHERVFAPVDAIKGMVTYVVCSIAVAARTVRPEVSQALPGLLEPFTTLDPIVEAMRLNAVASALGHSARREEMRTRYIELVDTIDSLEGDGLSIMDRIRAACCQSVATQEAVLGIAKDDPDQWLRSDDPAQRVGAEYIRKIAALHRGDWKAAQAHRRRAEVIGLQNDAAPMFSTLTEELETHALARDLTGLRRVRARIFESSVRMPRWRPFAEVADAFCHGLCGNPEAAMETIAQLRADAEREASLHRLLPLLEALAVEILLARGDAEQALSVGTRALAACEAIQQRHLARTVALALALAEAHLGRHEDAKRRVSEVIDAQRALGVSGLLLGRSHEFMARCALAEGDRAGFMAAADAAAEHYRPGRSEVLGALHERLMDDGRKAGLVDGSPAPGLEAAERVAELSTQLSQTFLACENAPERAAAALTLLREAADTDTGYLFLLSEGGVTLSAAAGNTDANLDALQAFAQLHIELEQDSDVCTMTVAQPEDDADGIPAEMPGPDGRVLHPVPLIGAHDDELLLAGVALLARPESDQPLGPVAAAVAKHLIEAGDCQPVVAA